MTVTRSKNHGFPLGMLARAQKVEGFVGSKTISRGTDFEPWPFTIETSHLMCLPSETGDTIIFSAPASAGQPLRVVVVYNSSKSTFDTAEAKDLLVSFEDDEARERLLAPVIEFGLLLCENQRRLKVQ